MVDEWTITEKGQRVLNMKDDEVFCGGCGEVYMMGEVSCPYCGYKPKRIVLAPKPGTPIVPDVYRKVMEEEGKW